MAQNKADYIFEKQTGQTLVKLPGSINGNGFALELLDNCTIHVLDFTSQVQIDDCTNCQIVIGPCDGSIFVRDCKNCTLWLASRQLRLRNCLDLTIACYCPTNPSIETSAGITFKCWNAAYPGLSQHFSEAKLDPLKNTWTAVYDFTPTEDLGRPHSTLDHANDGWLEVPVEGSGPCDCPVPLGDGTQYGAAAGAISLVVPPGDSNNEQAAVRGLPSHLPPSPGRAEGWDEEIEIADDDQDVGHDTSDGGAISAGGAPPAYARAPSVVMTRPAVPIMRHTNNSEGGTPSWSAAATHASNSPFGPPPALTEADENNFGAPSPLGGGEDANPFGEAGVGRDDANPFGDPAASVSNAEDEYPFGGRAPTAGDAGADASVPPVGNSFGPAAASSSEVDSNPFGSAADGVPAHGSLEDVRPTSAAGAAPKDVAQPSATTVDTKSQSSNYDAGAAPHIEVPVPIVPPAVGDAYDAAGVVVAPVVPPAFVTSYEAPPEASAVPPAASGGGADGSDARQSWAAENARRLLAQSKAEAAQQADVRSKAKAKLTDLQQKRVSTISTLRGQNGTTAAAAAAGGMAEAGGWSRVVQLLDLKQSHVNDMDRLRGLMVKLQGKA